jgi:hypothetical protein
MQMAHLMHIETSSLTKFDQEYLLPGKITVRQSGKSYQNRALPNTHE